MKSIEIIRALFDYHHALYERVWDSVEQLSDEQFTQEFEYSHGSIRDQLLHVATTDGRWLRGLQEVPGARSYHLDPADYPTRARVREVWEQISQETRDYLSSLDDEALQRVPTGMGGPVWHGLVHLVNHGTDHRAQILRALSDLDAPTFEQDLIFHLWSR